MNLLWLTAIIPMHFALGENFLTALTISHTVLPESIKSSTIIYLFELENPSTREPL